MLKTLALSIWVILHPVHVSLTSIDYIPGTDSLKVFFKIDFDDFLHDYQTTDDDRDLNKLFGTKPFPVDLVNKYFNSKVFIYINNKLLVGKLLSVDIDDNEINLSLFYLAEKKPRKITVRNLVLKGWYTDQENMTIIRINKFEKGIKFTPEYYQETFTLN